MLEEVDRMDDVWKNKTGFHSLTPHLQKQRENILGEDTKEEIQRGNEDSHLDYLAAHTAAPTVKKADLNCKGMFGGYLAKAQTIPQLLMVKQMTKAKRHSFLFRFPGTKKPVPGTWIQKVMPNAENGNNFKYAAVNATQLVLKKDELFSNDTRTCRRMKTKVSCLDLTNQECWDNLEPEEFEDYPCGNPEHFIMPDRTRYQANRGQIQ